MAHISVKHTIIDKTNVRIFAILALAAFLVVFFLVASFSLFSQLRYQNRIISHKETAVSTLKKDIAVKDSLIDSYRQFVATDPNLIGGSNGGSGVRDGSNAKITLDALPSKYDFPALTTSLERLLNDQKVKIDRITGVDDEIAQSTSEASGKPIAIEVPFETVVSGDLTGVQNVVNVFEHSIRPIQPQIIHISGDQSDLTLDVTAKTYYQPEKTLTIQKVVAK